MTQQPLMASSSSSSSSAGQRVHTASDGGKGSTATPPVRVQYLTPFALHGDEHVECGRVYRLADKRDCFAFRNFADAMDGFVLRHNKPGELLVWEKKLHGEAMHVVKAFVVFRNTTSAHGAVTPRLIYDMLHDAVFRETWDPYRIAAFCIARLNACNDIGYYAARSPAPLLVAGRDFINQRMWHDAGRGEYVIFNTSVPHDAVPSRPHRKTSSTTTTTTAATRAGSHNHGNSNSNGVTSECASCVRALSKIAGYFIRAWRDPHTGQLDGASLTYIAQSDLCGWIPTSITNYIASKYAPKTVATMRQALRTFEVWLPEQLARGTYQRDWDTKPEWWYSDDDDEDNEGDAAAAAAAAARASHAATNSSSRSDGEKKAKHATVANATVDEALRLWGMTPRVAATSATTTTAATKK